MSGSERGAPHDPLQVSEALFEAFEVRGVRYCHWKSNEHLAAGLRGDTDLDVLVDRASSAAAESAFAECGFKRFQAAPAASYPGVEDWLGFDVATGRLVHVHLHYRLVVGAKHLKGIYLPWDELALATRSRAEGVGTYVIDPHLELLLLVARSAWKMRMRERVRPSRRRRPLGKGVAVELAWLKERIDRDRLAALAESLIGSQAVAPLLRIVDEGGGYHGLREFRRRLDARGRLWGAHGPLGGRARRAIREVAWWVAGANARWLHRPLALRRSDPRGGLVVAVVGADGSGKSTVVSRVVRWLSWKLDVAAVYHGSGEGSASVLRWPLVAARRALRRWRGRRPRASSSRTPPTSRIGTERRLSAARVLWALTLAYEKRRKLQRSWRARHRGVIVVTDRYPQSQVEGFNDGPLLARWRDHPTRWRARLAAWEGRPYLWAHANPPDLVIKLDVDPRVAFERKPDDAMPLAEVRRRVDTVRGLRFPPDRTIVVSADGTLDDVLLAVKSAIWARL